MAQDNRPRSREKNVTSGGGNVNRRGDGLGTGPVGSSNGYQGRGGRGSAGKRAAIGGGISLPIIIIGIIYMLLSGGGSGGDMTSLLTEGLGSMESGSSINTSLGTSGVGTQNFSNASNSNYKLNTSVAAGSRAKRTVINGDGSDVITIMVYMCGTDLESRSGMASNDLAEMAAAQYGDNINLIVYTGGCTSWRTSGISSAVNQIYQVKNGQLTRLVEDDGARAMTDPSTLSRFIQWCATNFPANRNELIFWDHGGGSVSGYGYDEKYKNSGSMSLSGIKKALENGGVTFDFIGFDACLMATAETALMLDDFGDYLLASEETEPGIGWYYTNWLTKLGQNTSMSTLEIGKNIIDDYTNACASRCSGQKTTLSLIDLAEFANTVPDKLTSFSKSLNTLITNDTNGYKTVSNARYGTREFATSSKIDQIDLVNLAENMNNTEGRELSAALRGAVKYNRTSSNMTNAYGVSIYFPYQRTSYVDKACNTYDDIGMDEEYAKCIREFAGMETAGQVSQGGSAMGNPLGSLLGMGSVGSADGTEMIGQLLGAFLSNRSVVDGLDSSNTAYYSERALTDEETADYISMNYFDANNLFWTQNEDGAYVLNLPESQWELVHDIDLNMFYDDGEGYVDLGLDNMFGFDEEGNLVADTSGTWLAINGQVVPYYHLDTIEEGGDAYTISGRVPVLLNGVRANLILVFTDENPHGFIAGATTDYRDGETDTIAKSMTELNIGDTVDFVCDYYSYDGTYQDSYLVGNRVIVSEDMQISDVEVGDGAKVLTYRITDIYNQEHWTPTVE
ncbi:MAG: peptidase C11 [Lachnospiraceae bacterium]|nr:peptidase C11 [Lachnospiraceae bacterium]